MYRTGSGAGRHRGALAPILTLASLAVACGGGEPPKAPASAAPASAPAAPAPDFEPDLEAGRRVFMSVCVTCHGPDGRGIPKTGADLVHSKFVREHTDEELVAYVKRGRRVTDPENIMGLEMPPKGGAPYLDDTAIRNVVAYVRSLQEDAEE
ncbi:MAG: cytochrome c [Acidobacteria bacterium]|nr:MAG: cytochrome c [Acidobacteriota bacterium]